MRRLQRARIPMLAAIAMTFVAAPLACAPTIAAAQTAGKPMTTASGLQIIDSTVGTGASPKPGQTCVMHYTRPLYHAANKPTKFHTPPTPPHPLHFPHATPPLLP